jgi:hypothetical protein
MAGFCDPRPSSGRETMSEDPKELSRAPSNAGSAGVEGGAATAPTGEPVGGANRDKAGQELLKQLFETYYRLIEHERQLVQFVLWVSAALFAGLAWLYEGPQRFLWVVPAAGMLTGLCAVFAARRSAHVTTTTLAFGRDYVDPPACHLFAGYLKSSPASSTRLVTICITLAWAAVLALTIWRSELLSPPQNAGVRSDKWAVEIRIVPWPQEKTSTANPVHDDTTRAPTSPGREGAPEAKRNAHAGGTARDDVVGNAPKDAL